MTSQSITGNANVGNELRADTSGITSGDGELSFTYQWEQSYRYSWPQDIPSKEDHFVPTTTGRYMLTVTAKAGPYTKIYTEFVRVTRAEAQSAGSQNEEFQSTLDDPLSDLTPLQMDIVYRRQEHHHH